MQEEREPICSNIYDAINYMRNEIENCEAVVNETPLWNQLAWLPTPMMAILQSKLFAALGAYIILPPIFLIVFPIIRSGNGNIESALYDLFKAVLITFIIGFIIAFFLDSKKTHKYFDSKRRMKKLVPILGDLERLYQYDQNMNVGFKLDGKGDFDEIVLRGVMKKREREIKQQARS